MSGAYEEASERVTPELDPSDRLFIPHRKRLSHSYVVNDEGVRELRIDYGVKEITFDEEHLFAFAERMVREPSFTGDFATTWGPGYAWNEIRPLLETLVDEGILRRGETSDDPRGGGLVSSPLPQSVCPVARSWSAATCESLTQDLAGRAVEIGYLEALFPVYRIAHPALDSDGRQVGEANVFPRRLRLDRETEWRVCQYSGSRYRDDAPMNVTALKAMIKHWKPMMATIVQVCSELRSRLGRTSEPWTIGELHTLACVVLALPAYQLLKGGTAAPPPLHPVLSSLFRVTDGIRMTTHAMLFSVSHTRRGDEPMTAAALHEHVEQLGMFIGETGVCAGPKAMVDEFLAIVVDRTPPSGIAAVELPPEVSELIAELPAAIDYGLYAMQSWGASLAVWLAMTRAHEALLALLDASQPITIAWARLRARLRTTWPAHERVEITVEHDRDVHQDAYRDAYERSWQTVRSPVGPATLADAIAPVPEAAIHRTAADQLRAAFAARSAPADAERIITILIDYLRAEQAVLTTLTALQQMINSQLARPLPTRPLTVRDLAVNYALEAGPGAFPYLLDLVDDELGIRIESTAGGITVADRRAA